MINSPIYDVVIGGAGPAGAAAATVLCQAGLQVCLVDDVNDHAFKIGETLPGAAIRLLRRLGIEGFEQLIPTDAYHSCVANVSAWGSEDWICQDALLRPEGIGWHIERHEFDSALRRHSQAQGANLISGRLGRTIDLGEQSSTRPIHLRLRHRSTDLPAELHADWVIDATGRTNAVARQFGAQRRSNDDQMAVVARVHCPVSDADLTTRVKSVADGWWYTSRVPDGHRVVVFQGLPARIAQLVRSPRLFFSELNRTDLLPYRPRIGDLLKPLTATHSGLSRLDTAFGHRWIAVGDAALALDPLCSQGIFFALYSGIQAGEAILAAGKDPPRTDRICKKYQSQIDRVYDANRQALREYYAGELRYLQHNYWQQRLELNAGSDIRSSSASAGAVRTAWASSPHVN